MNKKIEIRKPQTIKEFEAYYLLRYEILRKPWNQPPGSEKDEQEDSSIHAMAVDEDSLLYGVCRMQYNSNDEAQLRYMAVKSDAQGMGVGKKLINYMEVIAKDAGVKNMVLQSRENAVAFYEKCGYSVKEKTFLMWGQIQHYLMTKKL